MIELNHIIELVKASTDAVETIVETYFASVNWTMLKDEYQRMSKAQKAKFLKKLDNERPKK